MHVTFSWFPLGTELRFCNSKAWLEVEGSISGLSPTASLLGPNLSQHHNPPPLSIILQQQKEPGQMHPQKMWSQIVISSGGKKYHDIFVAQSCTPARDRASLFFYYQILILNFSSYITWMIGWISNRFYLIVIYLLTFWLDRNKKRIWGCSLHQATAWCEAPSIKSCSIFYQAIDVG